MAIRIIKLGTPRPAEERLRVGTVRRPPRGVRKEDIPKRDIYDVWFPNLAPSEDLLRASFPIQNEKAWRAFKRAFLSEMKAPSARHDLSLLVAFSHRMDFAIGCYCPEEKFCHRTLLRDLLVKAGAEVIPPAED